MYNYNNDFNSTTQTQQQQRQQQIERQRRRRKQQQRQQRNKRIFTTTICLICLITMICLINQSIKQRQANYHYETTTNYIVSKGETIWTIAKQFSDNRHDIREVVFEIEKLSNTTALIFPGQELTIPVYTVMATQSD